MFKILNGCVFIGLIYVLAFAVVMEILFLRYSYKDTVEGTYIFNVLFKFLMCSPIMHVSVPFMTV